VILLPGVLGVGLVLYAAAGAAFAGLGLDTAATRPPRGLVILALVVTFLVILGAGLMAGRWGAAVWAAVTVGP